MKTNGTRVHAELPDDLGVVQTPIDGPPLLAEFESFPIALHVPDAKSSATENLPAAFVAQPAGFVPVLVSNLSAGFHFAIGSATVLFHGRPDPAISFSARRNSIPFKNLRLVDA